MLPILYILISIYMEFDKPRSAVTFLSFLLFKTSNGAYHSLRRCASFPSQMRLILLGDALRPPRSKRLAQITHDKPHLARRERAHVRVETVARLFQFVMQRRAFAQPAFQLLHRGSIAQSRKIHPRKFPLRITTRHKRAAFFQIFPLHLVLFSL